MTIGINIDGVLRNLLNKLSLTHKKYFESDVSVKKIKDYDLEKYFTFENDGDNLDKFLYEDCSLEIFGYADEIEEHIVTKLNQFIHKHKEDFEVKLLSRECGRAIPSTLFFLSKTSCLCRNIKFVLSYEDMWDECDILLTSFPKALEVKPEGKTSVKVKRNYNKKIKSDYSVSSTTEFFEEDYINKLINTKTVEHKELN